MVSWRLAATEPAARAADAAAIVERLESLVGVVPEIRTLQVGTDVVGNPNWDVVLIADYEDLDALARYQVHPAHEAVGAFIRSVVAEKSTVDVQF
ncbi:Dabb family protein [Cryobacterium zhongshanensis]|uniref:Dabb family protein n=1 Tax=Cryobacterium zhongshanensis TaxID=2928153 RepID=A0AA41QRB8_9MICO|nr:Dabb family protein [Cryobacterium zhongshanensis]MCI4656230.1 Dabb family protein [Cryobacterium zhongshanensis]